MSLRFFGETKMRNTPLAGLGYLGVAGERFRWWGANRGEVGEGLFDLGTTNKDLKLTVSPDSEPKKHRSILEPHIHLLHLC